MKTTLPRLWLGFALLSTLNPQLSTAFAQSTAFTYQGRLTDGANAASGSYDLRFILYDAEAGGSQQGPILTNAATAVSSGFFTVTLEFGANFPGADRWLEIAVRTNGGGTFDTLSPRQKLALTPYAITAANVVSGGLAPGTYGNAVNFNNPANQFAGNGAALSNVNAATLGGVSPSNFWQTGGNSGANANWYLGTADYQPLELRVNGQRAVRLEPVTDGAANTIIGAEDNTVWPGVRGGAINGGVGNAIGDGASKTLLLDESPGAGAVIGGGYANAHSTNASFGTIGGGRRNQIRDGTANTIFGGESNVVENAIGYSAIGGGFGNTNSGAYSVVPGGWRNSAIGEYSYASGRRARANHPGSFVWADAQDADFLSTSNNQFNVRADGGVRFVTSGAGMTLDGEPVLAGTVGASQLSGSYTKAVTFDHGGNIFTGSFSGNGASLSNVDASTLGGLAASNFWRLGGNAGTTNTFLGSMDNRPLEFRVNNLRAFRIEPDSISPNLIGGRFNIATNIFFQSAARGVVIGGGGQSTLPNVVEDDFGVIVGGSGNTNNGDSSFIGAGIRNYVEDRNNVLVGGLRNSLDGRQCFLGAGETNRILSIAIDSVLTGGSNNTVRADFATLSGGANNLIDSSSDFGTVSGGANNRIDFGILYGTIPGGFSNFVDGAYAFAAGRRARAVHDGAFVWADATDTNFASTGANQFLIRASGGMGLNVAQPRGELHVGNSSNAAPLSAASQTIIIENAAENGRAAFLALAGPGASSSTNRVELQLEANENERRAIIGTTSNHEIQIRQNNSVRLTVWTNGFVGIGNAAPTNRLMVVNARCDGSSWINSSDRNLKENFAPVNTKAVLEKVTALPLTRWNYKDDPGTAHLGPVAQDFKAGFGLGADDTSIATVDADGVALAAIQGLNQKLTEELKRRDTENAGLKVRLERLEELLSHTAPH